MTVTLETIKSNSRKKNVKRLGRGNSSGKGTYAARGLKGQKARSGGKGGLRQRAFKASLQKVPKLRGFKSPHLKPETVTLARLEKAVESGMEVTPHLLAKLGLIKNAKNGAKIVATGEFTKKITLKFCLATKKATEHIEKAGGKIIFS